MTLGADAMPVTRGLNFWDEDKNLGFVCASVMDPAVLERARPHLVAMGAVAGDRLDALAADADRNPPTLRSWDARGVRVDEVVFHPSYVEMMELAFCRFGLSAMSHRPGILGWPTPVPHVVKYTLSYLFAQSEFGLLCPVSTTDATARMLRFYGSPALRAAHLPHLTATDPAALGLGTQWMTERTGGSDVGALTTLARQDADGTWRLFGEKWFCSVADARVALTLARPEGAPAGTAGLGMFLVSRFLPDGSRNAWRVNRLKDKLGSRSMATGEVTFDGAVAHVVGELENGFRQMMEMVNISRLSNAMRAAGMMRRSLLESLVHARARAAFGRALADLPLMRQNLLEMLLDAEAAASVVLNAAAILDRWDGGDTGARPLFRILTPLAKCWITARARVVAGEAMSVRGGNGYIEEWVNPRLLRDCHLGAIWEGATNVVALDVQRAIVRDGGQAALTALVDECLADVREPAARGTADAVRAIRDTLQERTSTWVGLPRADLELQARPVADALYHLVAASLLLREGQRLRDETGSCRKLLVAALYLRRWLRPPATGAPAFTSHQLARLDALVDWTDVPASALAEA